MECSTVESWNFLLYAGPSRGVVEVIGHITELHVRLTGSEYCLALILYGWSLHVDEFECDSVQGTNFELMNVANGTLSYAKLIRVRRC